jgi:molybdopterin converting factor small subunit
LHANTIEQLLATLEQQHPLVWQRLCTEQGQLQPHVKMFVNNAQINGPDGLATPLKAGQEIIVLPVTSAS